MCPFSNAKMADSEGGLNSYNFYNLHLLCLMIYEYIANATPTH